MTTTRPTLSPAQMRVLVLVAEGYSGPEIAKALHLSVNTVKAHLLDLRETLGARDRAHAVAIAYRAGILGGDVEVER